MMIRGIRGATTVEQDTEEEIYKNQTAVRENDRRKQNKAGRCCSNASIGDT